MTELRPGMKIEITTSYTQTPGRTAALEDVATALEALRDKLDGTRATDVTMRQWADTLEAVRKRPGNRMHQTGEPACMDTDGVVRCLAAKGHTGDHVGYGSSRRWHNTDDDEVLDDWERELLAANDAGASFAEIAAKITTRGGMYGWFISYPDKPIGGTVLCAACASDPDIEARWLDKTQDYRAWPRDGQAWDGYTALRPVNPAYNTPGWTPTRDWCCLNCRKKGWPKT